MMHSNEEYRTEPTPHTTAPAFPPPLTSQADADGGEVESNVADHDRPPADREVPREAVADAPTIAPPSDPTALFESDELNGFNGRWSDIQTSFVDEPRRAVEQADALVADVIKRISDSFGKQRSQLEGQWDRGTEVSTEDLRQVFQRYRSFFSRLLVV
jgi:hypothetical protein